VLTREDCEALAAVAIEHDLFVVSDEIYSRLIYEAGTSPLLDRRDGRECVLMDGLSKAWPCAAGARLRAMPVQLAERMDTLMINTSSCAAAFTSGRRVEAFEGAASDVAVSTMMAEFVERRDVVVAGLNASRIRCHKPAGPSTSSPTSRGPVDERALQQRSSTRREWPSWPEPPSAATAGGTCASATPTACQLGEGHRADRQPARRAASGSGPLRRGGGELTEGRRPTSVRARGGPTAGTDHELVAWCDHPGP